MDSDADKNKSDHSDLIRQTQSLQRKTVNIDEERETLKQYEGLVDPDAILNRQGIQIDGISAVLRLEIEGGGSPLRLPLFDRAVVGRRDPVTKESPELDLTPYGAYQLGISRKHAIFSLENKVPSIIDLGSRNGSFLNGARLPANRPVPLENEDELRLGKITMKVWIEPGE